MVRFCGGCLHRLGVFMVPQVTRIVDCECAMLGFNFPRFQLNFITLFPNLNKILDNPC